MCRLSLVLTHPLFCFQRPVIKRNRKHSSRPRTSSPQRKPSNLGRKRGGRACRERHSSGRSPCYHTRSQSLSPLRAGNAQRPARLSLDSAAPSPASTSQPVSTHHTALFHIQPADGREEIHQVHLHTAIMYNPLVSCLVYTQSMVVTADY